MSLRLGLSGKRMGRACRRLFKSQWGQKFTYKEKGIFFLIHSSIYNACICVRLIMNFVLKFPIVFVEILPSISFISYASFTGTRLNCGSSLQQPCTSGSSVPGISIFLHQSHFYVHFSMKSNFEIFWQFRPKTQNSGWLLLWQVVLHLYFYPLEPYLLTGAVMHIKSSVMYLLMLLVNFSFCSAFVLCIKHNLDVGLISMMYVQ